MANKKITDLTELTAAASDDYLEIVDTSANTSKKISRENLIGGGGSGVTDHGALTGLSDNDHPQYLLTTAKAADSDKLDGLDSTAFAKVITLTAGDGLTGGGNLSANRTFDVNPGAGIAILDDKVIVDQTENFNWTGEHTFTQYLSTASIYPNTSDTYDLGDYNRLWRKIWGSELSAIVFAQYTQVLLGGWFTVSKGEGIIQEAVNNTQTTIDLGTNNFATNDIIVFRGLGAGNNPQIEYMKVGTLVSGTTYNVIRDLDGTGANAWPEGSVYGNWGQTGNGRVELNAYDTPRMSVYSQGMSYNDATEEIRIGDLYGQWGYNTNTYGAAFGSYKSGKANITIDPTNGIRIRNYNQDVIKLTGTAASFENFITLGTNGGIRQGTGTWGSSFTGTAMWNDSGVMNIGGWKDNVKQWWGGSDGKFYANAGYLSISNAGLVSALGIKAAGTGPGLDLDDWNRGRILFSDTPTAATLEGTDLRSYALNVGPYQLFTITNQSISSHSSIEITSKFIGTIPSTAKIEIVAPATGEDSEVDITADTTNINGNLVVNGTIKDGSGIAYGRPVFLAAPLTSTAWDGDAFSTTAKTKIDLSVVFGVPAGAKAIFVRLVARDSGSSAGYCQLGLSPNATADSVAAQAYLQGVQNDVYVSVNGVVPCDANGDIYYQIAASGAGTMDAIIEIWGYWL